MERARRIVAHILNPYVVIVGLIAGLAWFEANHQPWEEPD